MPALVFFHQAGEYQKRKREEKKRHDEEKAAKLLKRHWKKGDVAKSLSTRSFDDDRFDQPQFEQAPKPPKFRPPRGEINRGIYGFDVPEPAPLKPGGTGLALLSLASKIIDEPVRAVPLVLAGVYCFQLFLAEGQLLPGPSTLALDGATWVEVRDLSLNFWFVGPSLFGGFPVVHPGLEAIFNLVLAWSALFAGFAADGRRGRPQGSMLPTLAGMQFLTNAFFLPYLATRPREEEGVLVALDELTPAERAAESRALPVLLGGVGAVSIYWFCNARPDFGGLEERLGSLRTLLAGDRLGSSFLVDLGLYAAFQSWLIPDDLKRRGVAAADQAPFRALGAVPFVGLVAYLALRPRLPATRE